MLNLKDLSSERQWERFQYEELEMDERTDIDYLEDGITILCSLHYLDLVQRYATRVVGLREGEIVYQGSRADIQAMTETQFCEHQKQGRKYVEQYFYPVTDENFNQNE